MKCFSCWWNWNGWPSIDSKLKKYGAKIYVASMDNKNLLPKGIKDF